MKYYLTSVITTVWSSTIAVYIVQFFVSELFKDKMENVDISHNFSREGTSSEYP